MNKKLQNDKKFTNYLYDLIEIYILVNGNA